MSSERRTLSTSLGLLAITLLAFGLRSWAPGLVFVGDGDVVFYLGDAYYHVYRAAATLKSFPVPFSWDPYMNFPDGSHVPWPPLYDLFIAGLALCWDGTRKSLETIAAWAPPVIGALTCLPTFVAGFLVGGRAVGLGAALILAVLPAAAAYAIVGYADHHAASTFLGACLLACYLAALHPRVEGRRAVTVFVALAAIRAAIMLTWVGSLLYLGIGEGLLAVTLVVRGRRSLLVADALSALAAAAIILPAVLTAPVAIGGPYSSIELSRLHVALFVAVALWTGGHWLLWRRKEDGSIVEILAMGGLAFVIAGAFAALPGLLPGVMTGIDWVSQKEVWATMVLENESLFSSRPGAFGGRIAMGFFLYLIPVAPLFALLLVRDASMRGIGIFLFVWTVVLGLLSMTQLRYAGDFAPAAAVIFAWMLACSVGFLGRRLSIPPRLRSLAAIALGVLLLWPSLAGFHWPAFLLTRELHREEGEASDRALATVQGSLYRFAQEVRRVTPETSGYHDPDGKPEYSILAHPDLGHVLHYVAHRPTPANSFGPYIEGGRHLAVIDFFTLDSEAEALKYASSIRSRYVITHRGHPPDPSSLAQRLHADDGVARAGLPPWRHFRLVAEGPAQGMTLSGLAGAGRGGSEVPYKLFEIVRGCTLRVAAPPGTRVSASVIVHTTLDRSFRFATSASSAEDGFATLLVPYATQTRLPTRPLRPYRIEAGEEVLYAEVSDAQVVDGATLTLGPTSETSQRRATPRTPSP